MTSTATSPANDELAGSTIHFDLYREVHKGLRRALFELTTEVGAADLASVSGRCATVERMGAVVALLHAHHGHEDRFIQPLIVAHDAVLAALIDDGHADADADLVSIEQQVVALAAADGDEAVVLGLDLYRFLALFTARYLAHMAFEEGGVMAMLRQAMSVDELVEVEMALRGSVPPPLMCEFIAVMVPAMNPAERADMLGGMHAGAPPEIFEVFRSATEAALSPEDYSDLAGRIGIG